MKNGKLPTTQPAIFSILTKTAKPLVPQDHTYPPKETNYLLYPPTASSLSSVLQHYINSDRPSHGQKVHSHILKTGFKPNINISIKLLILHLKSSCILYARQVFDELSQPTLSAYNYLISGYVKSGESEKAFDLARKLAFCNEKPDGFTFSMILKASSCENILSWPRGVGKQVHAQIVKCDAASDDVLYAALVDSYVKSGRVDYARRLFDLMLEKNVVCCTSMISGYMKQCSFEDAEDIFKKTVEKDDVVFNAMIEGFSTSIETAKKALDVYIDMQRLEFRPTLSTFASVIGACSLMRTRRSKEQVEEERKKLCVVPVMTLTRAVDVVLWWLSRRPSVRLCGSPPLPHGRYHLDRRDSLSPCLFILASQCDHMLVLTCVCPCCLCVTVIVELALALVKASFLCYEVVHRADTLLISLVMVMILLLNS
ncbi:hypothetical protein RJ639_015303 [Escallonia herrerae]|uniref:Pentatricopeptide repeat-containing protein n=1 Tax=Escallonia herrerae TaxID=1293975 RepID=A0AA89ALN5_9ASTE|nr:hypothetical protein RJ639_015303 [Escallonia herrerae]